MTSGGASTGVLLPNPGSPTWYVDLNNFVFELLRMEMFDDTDPVWFL